TSAPDPGTGSRATASACATPAAALAARRASCSPSAPPNPSWMHPSLWEETPMTMNPRSDEKSPELATASVTGGIAIRNIDDLARLSGMLASSGYFKDARDAAQAGVKVLAGLEMGFGAFASMTGIHLIDGKPSVGANLLAQAVKRSGRYNYRVTKHTAEECVIAFFEHGEPIGESSFSMKDAQAAGVAGRGPWKAYPKAMLFARALSQGVRWHCPDVLGGTTAYVPEELGASVDGEGNVLTVEAPAVAQPAVVEAEEVVDATAAPSVPPLEFGQQSGAPSKPQGITKAQIGEFAAIAKHTGLDSATMARVAESFLDRDLPAGLKSLTSDEAAELVGWSHDKWLTEADSYRVPPGEAAA